MNTENVKNEARRLLDRLPDDVTWDELMHEIYVRQSIEAGLADTKAGKIVDVKAVREGFELPS
jgi:putative component of toxin-antitoxin plasmid stabilization module